MGIPFSEKRRKNEVALEITIEEGKKAWIRKVLFNGNENIGSGELRRKMNSRKRGFFGWLTGRGYLDEAFLENDIDVLRAFYYDQGYLRVKVERPRVIVGKKGKSITIEIEISEGSQFSVEAIDFKGDILTTKEDLARVLKTKKGEIYRGSFVQQDVLELTDLYADDVSPIRTG